MKTYLPQLLLLISFIFTSCTGQNSKVETIEPKTFQELLSKTSNMQLIDVRTPEEFNSEHIDKSVNINWNGDNFETEVAKYDKNQAVFVYCKAGGRSAQAAAKLSEMGFTKIYNLAGGMMKWNAEGLGKPIAKNSGMSMAQYQKLLDTDKKVLIDFSAKWCGPCQKMAPFIEKMKEELKDKVIIIKLDADENKSLCQELQIDGLPTLILYKNKKEVWKNLGFISEEDLRKKL